MSIIWPIGFLFVFISLVESFGAVLFLLRFSESRRRKSLLHLEPDGVGRGTVLLHWLAEQGGGDPDTQTV